MSIRSSRLLAKLYLSYFAVAFAGEAAALFLISVVLPEEGPVAHLALLAAALLLAALFAGIAVLFPRRYVLQPLQALTAHARAIAAGDFRLPRLSAGREGNDEVRELALAIGAMARQLEETFREIKQQSVQLEGILRSLLNGVIAIDRRHRIVLFNPVAERYFGVSAAEATGRVLLEVIRHFELATLCEEVLASGVPKTRELTVLLGSEERILQTQAAPVTGGTGTDVTAGVVVVFHDITELRRLERVRKDFVANVSHELRTPLTSIKGFVETLLDGAMNDPATCRRFLEIINQQTDRLVALVNDLLDLSRVESADIPLRRRPVDINALADEVGITLGPRAQGQGLRLELDLAPGLPLLYADDELLRRLLLNLVDNAIKYTPAGGRVVIRTRPEKTGGVALAVSDTGVGIPKRDLARIFERFYRVDKARSRQLGGTGLGLSIVRHIVEKHGATIEVESEVGEGSTFTVHFPPEMVTAAGQTAAAVD
ncbi:MAG: phosphate regulon sensor histidine kinase PhoR [Limnochordales bacterium]|nr:phosphate regulon sensor histidine kinase PhoR [Limnochordales bacterium]